MKRYVMTFESFVGQDMGSASRYMNNLKNLETYILDLEQPTTCPKCSARTDFNDVPNTDPITQTHTCLDPNCGYQFLGEFDNDFNSDNEFDGDTEQ